MDNHSNQPLLLRQVQDGVATLTLNRPDARNALSMALMGEMLEALRALGGLGEDPRVRLRRR